jgi:hypothetical protein
MKQHIHDFHIPVMGTAFTIDTPYKVAKYGIASVVSIGDDELCENMRKHYSDQYQLAFTPIEKADDIDYRAKRITAYLDLLNDLINAQIADIKTQAFTPDSDLSKYFELLANHHPMKAVYQNIAQATGDEKQALEQQCRDFVQPGAIDVNIMTKLDRTNYDANNQVLPDQYSDAVAALRGFANSKIDAGIVFSAGFNRRLFAHCEHVEDFYLTPQGFKKRLILKVSDYRSSIIQGRFLAKKGIWISEYRIESGLNCGGHAFATDGLLCGPILNEFKENHTELDNTCRDLCNQALQAKGKALMPNTVTSKITYQGGIGSNEEQQFLLDYFNVATTGWATPFLLVPEVTTLDMGSRILLKDTKQEDCYLSGNSPLGVPFNTVKNTESDKQKRERIENGRPGSPCPKGHLVFDTEFTKKPICKASVLYQKRKLEQLKKLNLISEEYEAEFEKIVEKSCLCEDLAAPALTEYGIENNRPLKSTVCAGPNIAYYKKIVSLKEMVDHIYGRLNLIDNAERPSFFVSELNMYIAYLKKEAATVAKTMKNMDIKRLNTFASNLYAGIQYYITLTKEAYTASDSYKQTMLTDFNAAKTALDALVSANASIFTNVVVVK